MSGPAWHPDPTRKHEYRYWDGHAWTSRVSDGGITGDDPLPRVAVTSQHGKASVGRPLVIAAVAALVVGSITFWSQRDGNDLATGGATTALTPGEFVPAIDTVVGVLGGSIVVPPAATPIDGLSVLVPAGAYTEDRSVSISWATLSGSDPTGLVTPLSPLIHFDDGGAYAGDVVEVTVPVTVPVGWIAMGFYRDEDDGSLEGLPLLRRDATSVTVGTRHFSEFFIAGVAEALLGRDVSTAFDPAGDQWQFPNVGTSVAPGGHCAGMSLTAMWFFLEQKPECGCSLRGRYDNEQAFTVGPDTPDLWPDDARGLRWATTVQKDVPWKGAEYYEAAWDAMYQVQSDIQLGAFRFAMAVTHEPQFVLLSTPTGAPAHAMVAYGVTGDQLLISDPNTPNKNPDYITYQPTTGMFAPFVSGVTADGPTISFANIGYAAKSALYEWDAIGTRFAEAEAGTIGMDRFDTFDLIAVELDANGMEVHNILTAGYSPTRTPIPVYAIALGRTQKVRATFLPGTSTTAVSVAEISTSAESTVPTSGAYAALDAATVSTYGVLIEVWSVLGTDAAGAPLYGWRWADFQRFSFATTAPPTTNPPTTDPPPTNTVDCSAPPPGVTPSKLNPEYMDWVLQCQGISP